MVRVLIVTVALVAAGGAGVGFMAMAQPASAQGQRMIEGRIVSLPGNQVMLNNGTMLTIPRDVAQPTDDALPHLRRLQDDRVGAVAHQPRGQAVRVGVAQYRDVTVRAGRHRAGGPTPGKCAGRRGQHLQPLAV